MKPSHPATGPLWLDLRSRSALGAVDALESTLLRGRNGARRVVVKVEGASALDAVRDWAEELEVPFTLAPRPDHVEVHLYVLPAEFGGHVLWDSPRRAQATRTDRYAPSATSGALTQRSAG